MSSTQGTGGSSARVTLALIQRGEGGREAGEAGKRKKRNRPVVAGEKDSERIRSSCRRKEKRGVLGKARDRFPTRRRRRSRAFRIFGEKKTSGGPPKKKKSKGGDSISRGGGLPPKSRLWGEVHRWTRITLKIRKPKIWGNQSKGMDARSSSRLEAWKDQGVGSRTKLPPDNKDKALGKLRKIGVGEKENVRNAEKREESRHNLRWCREKGHLERGVLQEKG